MKPLDQAHWKLKPPMRPSTSSTSPAKNRPGQIRLSIVSSLTSVSGTPPAVASAMAKPRSPVISSGIAVTICTSFFRASRGRSPLGGAAACSHRAAGEPVGQMVAKHAERAAALGRKQQPHTTSAGRSPGQPVDRQLRRGIFGPGDEPMAADVEYARPERPVCVQSVLPVKATIRLPVAENRIISAGSVRPGEARESSGRAAARAARRAGTIGAGERWPRLQGQLVAAAVAARLRQRPAAHARGSRGGP